MKREFELNQQKIKLEEHYSILDKKEREQFSHLQAKINIFHEKSKSHTRQWRIISTILGALFGIAGTSISAYYRNSDIIKIQRTIQTQLEQQIEQILKESQRATQIHENLIEHFQRYNITLQKVIGHIDDKSKTNESWVNFFKRKTISVYRWCWRYNS